MQSKAALRFLIIILIIACIYELSFTVATTFVERDAEKYATADSSLYAGKSQFYRDSVISIKTKQYLDSMNSVVVYNLGVAKFTYKECKSKEINLGLDLRGGMNLTMEVSVADMVKVLSNNSTDTFFTRALQLAQQRELTSRENFIQLFGQAFTEIAPNDKLSRIFAYGLKDKLTSGTAASNQEVLAVLQTEVSGTVKNAYNVLRNRIDRFGVTQPNIQRMGESGRILVELPGVKDPDRVRKLLQGTANLEFWETYTFNELQSGLSAAANTIMELEENLQADNNTAQSVTTTPTVSTDTTKKDGLLSEVTQDSTNLETTVNNPLLQKLITVTIGDDGKVYGIQPHSPELGIAEPKDMATIEAWLSLPQVRSEFPSDCRFVWSIKSKTAQLEPNGTTKEYYELIALKGKKAVLDGGVIETARREFNPQNKGQASVSMIMNPTGSSKWGQITFDNIGKSIAIVLDDYVYSYPTVQNEIKGGVSSITGNFSIEEADDLANVLKSGKLPAPVRIVQSTIVGPTLGQESIDSGLFSFIIAFGLVLLYMFFFYNRAGLVANIALLINIFILIGVLCSLGAVLTLPGIAGIVLTMGMAVDANVIIYERIKEEILAGKGVKLAVSDGYKNAYSAIIDGNATTLITGICLFLFGSGPIQGFATTLIIGILTSLFCSILVSRLIFTTLLDRNKVINFDRKLTRHFLDNLKFNYIKSRKIAYIFSITLTVVIIVSLFVRGVSWGIDFSGGRVYDIRFDQPVSVNDVRSAIREKLATEKGASVEVKQFGTGGQQVRIVTDYLLNSTDPDAETIVQDVIYEAVLPLYAHPLTKSEFESTDKVIYGIISAQEVGPAIAEDIKYGATMAIFFALLAIFIYIAIRFKKFQWALGGVISLAHDAMVTIGIFSLFHGLAPWSMDIDQSFIAAILTIIGYSINDTVIIFDRIRENMKEHSKTPLDQNINNSINSVMSRTVNTVCTTLIVLLAIFIFGGEVIRGFSFALIVGILVGTYSSIFIATPIAYDVLQMKQKKLQK